MSLRKMVCAAVLGGACLASVQAFAAPACEINRPVVFAGLDWDSNAFHVALARFILEKGYGCTTEDIPGSTIPLLNGMARGDIDVTMEMWVDNVRDAWDPLEKSGKVELVAVNFPDAVQGWFVPRYLVEGPDAKAKGLKSVADLPKFKALFKDPEEPEKGRFYNGIAGWGAEVVSTKKLKAYALEKDYTNFRAGTGAALASVIASAYKRKKPILYYYWGPTWVMGKFDSVMLEEPPYDKAVWDKMMASETPVKATAFPLMKVYTAINSDFGRKAPMIKAFLANYRTSNALVSKALAVMQDKKGTTAGEAAQDFLKTQKTVWRTWVPADVADRVEAALK
ncbi:MAG: ABC transporter substrate-binding protein [Rhodospirillaceae bacterium]|nr:ABC transporter substrate-binding protein [Rhodospirillaceae bacterium]